MTKRKILKEVSVYAVPYFASLKKNTVKTAREIEPVFDEIIEIFNAPKFLIKSSAANEKKSRKSEYVIIRQLFCYVAVNITNESLENIGKFLGYSNKSGNAHTTVLYSSNKFSEGIENEDEKVLKFWTKYKKETKLWK